MERSGSWASLRGNASLAAALALLVMVVLSGFGNFMVLERLIVPGNGAATAAELAASATLFRWGVLSLVFICVLDILVAVALRELFSGTNRTLSDLAAWFRMIYAGVFLVGICHLLVALGGLSNGAFVLAEVDTFYAIWEVGLIFIGLHLLVLGYLVYRSGFVPRMIGLLVALAGAGYLADSIGTVLIADYSFSFTAFLFVGEVVLMGWCFYDWARNRRGAARIAMAS